MIKDIIFIVLAVTIITCLVFVLADFTIIPMADNYAKCGTIFLCEVKP